LASSWNNGENPGFQFPAAESGWVRVMPEREVKIAIRGYLTRGKGMLMYELTRGIFSEKFRQGLAFTANYGQGLELIFRY
jgi:hypothetical protein